LDPKFFVSVSLVDDKQKSFPWLNRMHKHQIGHLKQRGEKKKETERQTERNAGIMHRPKKDVDKGTSQNKGKV